MPGLRVVLVTILPSNIAAESAEAHVLHCSTGMVFVFPTIGSAV